MIRLADYLKQGGRKYAVVVRTLELGALLSLVGVLAAVMRPEIAVHIAAIIGTFGLLGSASIVSYQGANAAADWKNPGAAPAPRQSGTVKEPPLG
jgi:hypothetical protein